MIGTPKQLIIKMLELDQEKQYELKEHKKKRTRNQNNYYWELLNQLSNKMKTPTEELHFELLKKSSPQYEILVPSDYNIRGIEYYELKGQRQSGGKVFNIYRVYTPSHELNTVEMGILLDNLIEECKAQGINTITPDELAKMRSLENR